MLYKNCNKAFNYIKKKTITISTSSSNKVLKDFYTSKSNINNQFDKNIEKRSEKYSFLKIKDNEETPLPNLPTMNINKSLESLKNIKFEDYVLRNIDLNVLSLNSKDKNTIVSLEKKCKNNDSSKLELEKYDSNKFSTIKLEEIGYNISENNDDDMNSDNDNDSYNDSVNYDNENDGLKRFRHKAKSVILGRKSSIIKKNIRNYKDDSELYQSPSRISEIPNQKLRILESNEGYVIFEEDKNEFEIFDKVKIFENYFPHNNVNSILKPDKKKPKDNKIKSVFKFKKNVGKLIRGMKNLNQSREKFLNEQYGSKNYKKLENKYSLFQI